MILVIQLLSVVNLSICKSNYHQMLDKCQEQKILIFLVFNRGQLTADDC